MILQFVPEFVPEEPQKSKTAALSTLALKIFPDLLTHTTQCVVYLFHGERTSKPTAPRVTGVRKADEKIRNPEANPSLR